MHRILVGKCRWPKLAALPKQSKRRTKSRPLATSVSSHGADLARYPRCLSPRPRKLEMKFAESLRARKVPPPAQHLDQGFVVIITSVCRGDVGGADGDVPESRDESGKVEAVD